MKKRNKRVITCMIVMFALPRMCSDFCQATKNGFMDLILLIELFMGKFVFSSLLFKGDK